jgi:hypothetical protein
VRIGPILAGFLLVAAMPAVAQQKVMSVYTSLDLDRCKQLDHGETPESTEWRCSGYRGVPLFVQNGDERYDVDAGVEDEDAIWAHTFDYPGSTVEWRLTGGKPFAIIYRLQSANPERPRTTVLAVESVGMRGHPGCRVAMIPGSARNANRQARSAADRLLRARPVCLKPQ